MPVWLVTNFHPEYRQTSNRLCKVLTANQRKGFPATSPQKKTQLGHSYDEGGGGDVGG